MSGQKQKVLKPLRFQDFSWSEWRDLNSRPLDPQSHSRCHTTFRLVTVCSAESFAVLALRDFENLGPEKSMRSEKLVYRKSVRKVLEAHLLLRNQVGERRAKSVRLLLCLLGCAKVLRGDARGRRGLHRLRLSGRNEAGPAPARMFPAGPASFPPGCRFARCQACFDCQAIERTAKVGLRDCSPLVTMRLLKV